MSFETFASPRYRPHPDEWRDLRQDPTRKGRAGDHQSATVSTRLGDAIKPIDPAHQQAVNDWLREHTPTRVPPVGGTEASLAAPTPRDGPIHVRKARTPKVDGLAKGRLTRPGSTYARVRGVLKANGGWMSVAEIQSAMNSAGSYLQEVTRGRIGSACAQFVRMGWAEKRANGCQTYRWIDGDQGQ